MAKSGRIGWTWRIFRFEYNGSRIYFVGLPEFGQIEKLEAVNNNPFIKVINNEE